ncbi:MAG TPA: GNAT family N-acetyltransferase [Longimicrobiales bacterium]|nr:GNAT family N-acetyltransferase [Longimicrobiales bacterium]
MSARAVPDELLTERLHLRCWRRGDAVHLLPVLEVNVDHLQSWIPEHVAAPAPLPDLEERLAGFAADFRAGRNWRYGVFAPDDGDVLGEISLFPRSAAGRVHIGAADRLEVGYWLRRDVTGRGYATEAARAMLSLAGSLPGMSQVEIRCDPLNTASAAIPKRLGFRLDTQWEPDTYVLDLASPVHSTISDG